MSKWKTEDHFVSWLRLCPDNRISGDKIIGKGRLPTNNRVSIALKMAASSLRQSKTYLGAQFRRLSTSLGAPVAIKAMAAKLARLIYRMLRHGMKYVDQGAAFYEAQHRQVQIKQLKLAKRASFPQSWLCVGPGCHQERASAQAFRFATRLAGSLTVSVRALRNDLSVLSLARHARPCAGCRSPGV